MVTLRHSIWTFLELAEFIRQSFHCSCLAKHTHERETFETLSCVCKSLCGSVGCMSDDVCLLANLAVLVAN